MEFMHCTLRDIFATAQTGLSAGGKIRLLFAVPNVPSRTCSNYLLLLLQIYFLQQV